MVITCRWPPGPAGMVLGPPQGSSDSPANVLQQARRQDLAASLTANRPNHADHHYPCRSPVMSNHCTRNAAGAALSIAHGHACGDRAGLRWTGFQTWHRLRRNEGMQPLHAHAGGCGGARSSELVAHAAPPAGHGRPHRRSFLSLKQHTLFLSMASCRGIIGGA